MIPLVGFKTELDMLAAASPAVAEAIKKERGKVPAYLIGTMIELPRAALRAGEIAQDRGVLLLRHQRSDADHARASAATMPACSSPSICARA